MSQWTDELYLLAVPGSAPGALAVPYGTMAIENFKRGGASACGGVSDPAEANPYDLWFRTIQGFDMTVDIFDY